MANPAAPYYDNVQWPGGDGIRVPTEVFGSNGAGKPGGVIALDKEVLHSYGSAAVDWTLNPAETAGAVFRPTLASGAVNAIFPAVFPGKVFVVNNTSGQALTVKVAGQTGIAVASTKVATLSFNATDVIRVTADT